MRISLLLLILLAAAIPTSSLAQSDCATTHVLPIGLANQGGYAFNYQSGKGKDCRRYRLRNTPGNLLTPVLWRDTREVFMDVDLVECPKGSICPWVDGIRISTEPATPGRTTLSFGLNKDEYKDEPDAYRLEETTTARLAPLITILRGIVADSAKKPFELNVQVASYVEGGRPYRLTYEIITIGKPGTFQLLPTKNVPEWPKAPALIWDAAASKPFLEYLSAKKIKFLPEKLIVQIEAEGIEVEQSKLLMVVQGNKRIAATTAPAYRPKD